VKQQQCESENFIVINDGLKRFARDFDIKWKEGEREQYRRGTEREWVREAECCGERKIASARPLENKHVM
jgi:hypothetical protein